MRRFSLLIILNLFFLFSFSQEIKVKEPLVFLALGDSYTIGQSVPEEDRWPVQLGERLELLGVDVQEVEIRARTGWTTGNLLASLASDTIDIKPNLVSLLIGVNNQYQGRSVNEYAEEFEELLVKALNYVDNDPQAVFVVSIPDYAYTPFGSGSSSISSQIDNFNDINRGISSGYQVPYINITGISRDGLAKPEYVASDGLHPSGIQYGLWVDEILRSMPLTGLTNADQKFTGTSLKVYPSPFSEILFVKVDQGFDEGKIVIRDITGKMIYKENMNAEETILYLNFLSKGIYFLTVLVDDSELHTTKILKK